MSESGFKNNNAYFLKEGLLIILMGAGLCLLTYNFSFSISGTSLLVASIVCQIIGRLLSLLQTNYMCKYFRKNNVHEISEIVHWYEKDYDNDYCKKARKISKDDLKKNPQYYPYLYSCIEKREESDSFFWGFGSVWLAFLSLYAYSHSSLVLLAEVFFCVIVLRISNPERNIKTNTSGPYPEHYSIWRIRKEYTKYYMTVFFVVLFCLLSVISINASVDVQSDITFMTYLASFSKKFHFLIYIAIAQIIRGVYLTMMDFYSVVPENNPKGLYMIMNWAIVLGLMLTSSSFAEKLASRL